MALSKTIQEAIKGCGSIYRAAQLSGVSQPVLQRFMRGERDIRLRTAERVCEALGLELAPKASKPKRRRQPGPKR